MGESIVEGTLTKWLKKPGERVERDEPLFEISTDKVDTEIPSPAAGTMAARLVADGTTAAIRTTAAGRDADPGNHPANTGRAAADRGYGARDGARSGSSRPGSSRPGGRARRT